MRHSLEVKLLTNGVDWRYRRQNRAPPHDVYALTSGTCGYVTLRGKGDFLGVNKLKILKGEDYPGLSGRAQWVPRRGKKAGQSQRRCCGETGGCFKARQAKARTWPLPRASRRNVTPSTLGFSPTRLISDGRPPERKGTHLS